jgi:hypothetical protein
MAIESCNIKANTNNNPKLAVMIKSTGGGMGAGN